MSILRNIIESKQQQKDGYALAGFNVLEFFKDDTHTEGTLTGAFGSVTVIELDGVS